MATNLMERLRQTAGQPAPASAAAYRSPVAGDFEPGGDIETLDAMLQAVERAKAPPVPNPPAALQPPPPAPPSDSVEQATEPVTATPAPQEQSAAPVPVQTELVATAAPAIAAEDNRVNNEAPLQAINANTFMSHFGDGVLAPHREAINAETGMHLVTPISAEAINTETAHLPQVRTYRSGRERYQSHGTAWVHWPKRRTYPAGIGMWPDGDCPGGAYNLYRGLGVTPREGDAGPMLRKRPAIPS